MKTNLLILGLLAGSSLASLAQPTLEKKSIAENPKVEPFTISAADGVKKMLFAPTDPGFNLDPVKGFTIETKTRVANDEKSLRGFSVEVRDAKADGFRMGVGPDGIVNFTDPASPVIVSGALADEVTPVYRYAVKDGKVYVYKNGAYKGETSFSPLKKENLIENGSFEMTDRTGWWLNWTSSWNETDGRTGKCMNVGAFTWAGAGTACSYEVRDLVPGNSYTLSFYAKKVTMANNLRYAIQTTYTDQFVESTIDQWNELKPGTGWTLYTKRFEMPANNYAFRFSVMNWNGENALCLLDDFSLVENPTPIAESIEKVVSEDFETLDAVPAEWSMKDWPWAGPESIISDGSTKFLRKMESAWLNNASIVYEPKIDLPVVVGKCYKLKARIKSNSGADEFIELVRAKKGSDGKTVLMSSVKKTFKITNTFTDVETPWILAEEGDQFLVARFSLKALHSSSPNRYLDFDKVEVLETDMIYSQYIAYGKSTVLGVEAIDGDYLAYDLTGAYAPTDPDGVEGSVTAGGIYYSNGKLYTNGAASQATVYSTVGAAIQTVAIQADATAALDLAQGIYVVKVGGQTLKVVVK